MASPTIGPYPRRYGHVRAHFQARREQLLKHEELSPESQGRNLALTVLDAPDSLDGGPKLVAHPLAHLQGYLTHKKTHTPRTLPYA